MIYNDIHWRAHRTHWIACKQMMSDHIRKCFFLSFTSYSCCHSSSTGLEKLRLVQGLSLFWIWIVVFGDGNRGYENTTPYLYLFVMQVVWRFRTTTAMNKITGDLRACIVTCGDARAESIRSFDQHAGRNIERNLLRQIAEFLIPRIIVEESLINSRDIYIHSINY